METKKQKEMQYFHDFALCKKSINRKLLKIFGGVPPLKMMKTAVIPEPIKLFKVQNRRSIPQFQTL